MEPAPRGAVAYNWDHLLCELLTSALSTYGWRILSSKDQISRSSDIRLALLYCSSRTRTEAIEAIRRVNFEHPGIRIIMLCSEVSGAELRRFNELGIALVVRTDQCLKELLHAMELTRQNHASSHGLNARPIVEKIGALIRQHQVHDSSRLTLREKEVLHFITRGLSNKEIASCLSITPNTVKNHVHNLLEKLNVKSRHEAAWVEIRWKRNIGPSQGFPGSVAV
jgi:DNA-binding NarL/FixJ family response regulator